ncbi:MULTISPECIES: HD domain-containing protein [unclassified Nonomuraea]|uniref:HD domain-containing protein n=1 Tax=unclassified Nonomuraea TaxID=2593643 RepID=UPI0033FAC8F8
MLAPLIHALTDPSDPPIRPLPPRVAALLESLDTPPRLAAHLRAVHDVACEILDWLDAQHTTVRIDREAVLFGAASHDIGKILHLEELSGPGSIHEPDGYELLRAHGVEERLARFARTHASWTASDTNLEDHLVSLADKIWKAKRVVDLEQLIVDRLAAASGRPAWQVFMGLDEFITRVANDADSRLAFQSTYPIKP